MNTEPVAWMEYIQGVEWEIWFVEPTNLPDGHTYKPLYTHPAKTPTDEEIEEIAEQYKDVDYTLDDEEPFDVFDYKGFARAILRKANEK